MQRLTVLEDEDTNSPIEKWYEKEEEVSPPAANFAADDGGVVVLVETGHDEFSKCR